MKSAYAIGHISVKDPEKWTRYRDSVPATLKPWGGELMLRGKLSTILSGQHAHQDTVVIRFPDITALHHWHASAEYQSLIPLRLEAAEVDLLAFEE